METFNVDSDDVSVKWSILLDLIMDGAYAVSSFVMRSTIPWNMFVPLDNTALAYKLLRMFTSHFMTFWIRGLPYQ